MAVWVGEGSTTVLLLHTAWNLQPPWGAMLRGKLQLRATGVSVRKVPNWALVGSAPQHQAGGGHERVYSRGSTFLLSTWTFVAGDFFSSG